MDGLAPSQSVITVDDILPVLMAMSKQDLTNYMARLSASPRPTGFKVLFSKDVGRAQAAMGLRRQFNYFNY